MKVRIKAGATEMAVRGSCEATRRGGPEQLSES